MRPPNPWLSIPLADYEAHMSLPGVGQAQMLAQELDAAAQRVRASSVAVVGCAGGNGFDGLADRLQRLVAIDINPAYVEVARARFGGRHAQLETYVCDIEQSVPACAPVDLVFAGLLLEYVEPVRAMAALRRLCHDEGTLVIVTQVIADEGQFVSPSPYIALQALQGFARSCQSAQLEEHARASGFSSASWRRIRSVGGKSFDVGDFAR